MPDVTLDGAFMASRAEFFCARLNIASDSRHTVRSRVPVEARS
jgi:hypothetical protein